MKRLRTFLLSGFVEAVARCPGINMGGTIPGERKSTGIRYVSNLEAWR